MEPREKRSDAYTRRAPPDIMGVTQQTLDNIRGLHGNDYLTDESIEVGLFLVREEARTGFLPIDTFSPMLFADWLLRDECPRDRIAKVVLRHTRPGRVRLDRLEHWLGCLHITENKHWLAADICIQGNTRRITLYDSLLVIPFYQKHCYARLAPSMESLLLTDVGNFVSEAHMRRALGAYSATIFRVVLFLELYMAAIQCPRAGGASRDFLMHGAQAGTRQWLIELRAHAGVQRGGDCGPLSLRLIQVLGNGTVRPRPRIVRFRGTEAPPQDRLRDLTEMPEWFALDYPDVYVIDGWTSTVRPTEAIAVRKNLYENITRENGMGLERIDHASAHYTPLVMFEELLFHFTTTNSNVYTEENPLRVALVGSSSGTLYRCIEYLFYLHGLDPRLSLAAYDYTVEEGIEAEDVDLVVSLENPLSAIRLLEREVARNDVDAARPWAVVYGFREASEWRYFPNARNRRAEPSPHVWYISVALDHTPSEATLKASHSARQFRGVPHACYSPPTESVYPARLRYMSLGLV